MNSITFEFDAFAATTPESEMSPLLAKAVSEGEKVDTDFLEWVSPGLGKAWKEYYLPSHRLRIEGRRKNAAGDIGTGAAEQLQAIALLKKWNEFWEPRKNAILKKLGVAGF